MRIVTAAALCGLLALAGCERDSARGSAPTPPIAAKTASIDWFDGSVEQAFAQAREQERPLFVYWGATWCPPCNQLKSTVFTQPEFIASTRRYVAVQIDGDDADAQRWAEHFGAMGYPTLIVFDALGREVTRLSSGRDLGRYAQALSWADSGRPVAELVAQLQGGAGATLSPAEWEQLAFYPWDADGDRLLDAEQRRMLFARLRHAEVLPSDRLRRRFALLWWTADPPADDRLTPEQRKGGREVLRTILQRPEEWRANLSELQYGGVDWIARVSTGDASLRESLLAAYLSVMEAAWRDQTLGLKPRLLTVRARIAAHELQHAGGPLPAALRDTLRQRILQITKAADTPYLRQSLVYNAAWYLHQLGDSEAAVAMLQAELETAIAPHYYMSYLADIAAARGETEAALEWSAKAFASARGPATRLQWGIAHLRSQLELSPQRVADIGATLEALRAIAREHPGALYQRSRVRLAQLQPELQAWAADDAQRAAALRDWRREWAAVCAPLEADSAAAQTCRDFAGA